MMVGSLTYNATAKRFTAPTYVQYSGTGRVISMPHSEYFHFVHIEGGATMEHGIWVRLLWQ